MYNKIYRCKLCQETIIEKIYGETDQSINIMLTNNDISGRRIHYCNDKAMGVLEIIGIKKVDDSQYILR